MPGLRQAGDVVDLDYLPFFVDRVEDAVPDQTLWLRDVFIGTRHLTTWHGTPGPEALGDDGASTT